MTRAGTVGEAGEAALLARIRTRLATPPPFVLLGAGDDAAIVAPERNAADVLTADALVEGVHFDRRLMGPEAIGHRALAVNLSDLAAMGATPRVALLSMGLPEHLPLADFDGLIEGLLALAARHRTALVGGNLTRSPGPLFLDVTAVGSVRPRRALRRDTARPGDELYVSGRVGAATAGLAWLRAHPEGVPEGDLADAVTRYRQPEPRVRLGVLVGRSRAASACMDLSDGLGDALTQLAGASGLSAEVDAALVPVHPALTRALPAEEALARACASDDYELLFAVPPRRRRALVAAAALARVPLTRIGTLRKGAGVRVMDAAGASLSAASGYAHFSS